MRLGIMQPYFLPYIGYFQLMNAVDKFVVYDNIKYTKKGWINRNRFLHDGSDDPITLPLKKDSDYLHIRDRYIADEFFGRNSEKLLRRIENAYKKAPHFKEGFSILEECLAFKERNLFQFIFNSLKIISEYLGIDTKIIISSTVNGIEELKSQEKVLYICKALGADEYVNAIGGMELYNKKKFSDNGIKLSFIRTNSISYPQFNEPFIPDLSILDVIMFNDVDSIKKLLERYELV